MNLKNIIKNYLRYLDCLTLNSIFLKRTIMNKINLIDLESIPLTSWGEASELTKNVDEFDIPFIALSLALGAPLLTGDKKLKKGLEEKGVNWIFTFKILMPYFDFLVVLSNFNSWQYF